MRLIVRGLILVGAALCVAPSPAAQPDTFVVRGDALKSLQVLDGELLAHDSATDTLEHWCSMHRLAFPARIVAERVIGVDKQASQEQRRELQVAAGDELRYRRVRLKCGAVVLSEADNWYVPSRLTPAMNDLLDRTDMPFGRVVKPLDFRRHHLNSIRLWEERGGVTRERHGAIRLPTELLRHRALLTLPDGMPISEVVETYEAGVLAFAVPRGH